MVNSCNPNDNSASSKQPAPDIAAAPVSDQVLKCEKIQIGRKRLICTLKENHHGKYLRICEESGSHRNTIIIPANGIELLQRALATFGR